MTTSTTTRLIKPSYAIADADADADAELAGWGGMGVVYLVTRRQGGKLYNSFLETEPLCCCTGFNLHGRFHMSSSILLSHAQL